MEFSTIGKALRSRRQNLNMDQTRAAAIVGMSRTSYSSYERDLQRPSVEVLPSLAEFLEIPIDDVLTLYGGTCIEAVRPSLEKFLATGNVSGSPQRVVQGEAPEGPGADEADSVLEDHASPQGRNEPEIETEPEVQAEPEVRPAPDLASASIFANELSHDNSRSTSRTDVSDRQDRSSKASKDKSGKKKKKKGKK